MSGALRKTMVYLGLADEDNRYRDDYDFQDESEEDPMSQANDPFAFRSSRHVADQEQSAAVTPITRGRMMAAARSGESVLHRITTIHPRTYSEAKTIGEAFRGGTPVIMNLGDMDEADAKRVVDFAAGLIFGLHGSIERVTNKVFLLSPATIEVTGADQVNDDEPSGFFNQN